MKILTIILTISILFLLTGCSYFSNFFIYNLTDQTVTIVYKLTASSSYGTFITNPELYKIEKENNGNKLTRLDNRTVDYSPSTKTVTCKLDPKEAMNIGNDINFTITNYEERKRIGDNVDQLTIINNYTQDTLTCSGDFIYLLLSELDDNAFGIRIE